MRLLIPLAAACLAATSAAAKSNDQKARSAPARVQAASCAAALDACLADAPSICIGALKDPSCAAPLLSLRRCVAEVVRDCPAGLDAPAPGDQPIAGALWKGSDGKSAFEARFCFEVGGVVDYETATGHWRTGRWIQAGGWIAISMNDGYAVYLARPEPEAFNAFGWNVNDLRWRTEMTPDLSPPPGHPSALACPRGES